MAISKASATALIIAAFGVSACGSLPTYRQDTNTIPAAEAAQQEANKEVKSKALYIQLVGKMQERGKHRAAIAFVDEYEQFYSSDPMSRYLRGASLVALKEFSEAEAILTPLTTSPLAHAAYNELGKMWAAQGDWTRAASHFELAREKAPTKVSYLNNLGYAELNTGRYADAERVLLQALELDEDNVSVRNNLILAKFLMGKKSEARTIILSLEGDERERVIALLKQWNDTVLVGSPE